MWVLVIVQATGSIFIIFVSIGEPIELQRSIYQNSPSWVSKYVIIQQSSFEDLISHKFFTNFIFFAPETVSQNIIEYSILSYF